ncbi:MAG: SRPBCC family protein [Dehalococcoidia bacterium]
MHTEVSIDINAAPDRVWDVMSDVESWPQWTPSIKHVDKLFDGPLAKGARTRIAQPKAPVAVWTVTEIEPGKFFEWETSSPAITSVAAHRIEPTGDGSKVTLTVEHSGLFTVVMGWWLKSISRKYVEMEAKGLKARAETGDSYKI